MGHPYGGPSPEDLGPLPFVPSRRPCRTSGTVRRVTFPQVRRSWKVGCGKSCMPGLEGGNGKGFTDMLNTEEYLAGGLPYAKGTGSKCSSAKCTGALALTCCVDGCSITPPDLHLIWTRAIIIPAYTTAARGGRARPPAGRARLVRPRVRAALADGHAAPSLRAGCRSALPVHACVLLAHVRLAGVHHPDSSTLFLDDAQ